MSNDNFGGDNLRSELGRTLHQQADGIGGTPISFEQVKGTAGRIRRRRAIAASAAVAAAVAIVVPAGIFGSNLLPQSSENRDPATQGPTPTQTVDAVGDDVLDVRDLPTGPAPRLVWIGDGVLHDGDRELRLDAAYEGVVKLGDRYLATANDEGVFTVDVLDSSGVATATYPLSGGLATNAAGTIVAWMDADHTPRVLQEGLAEPLELPAAEGQFGYSNAVGVLGDDCTTDAETTEDGGCTVYFTADDTQGKRSTYASASHGTTAELAVPPGHAVTALSEDGRRITITEIRDDGTCSEAVSNDSAAWSTCDYRGLAYSPDGSKLLAHDGYGSGLGDTRLAVLDAADGDPLIDLKSTMESQAAIFGQTWEDDEHLLAVAYQDGQWSVVRFGLDGSREYAVPPQPGEDVERPIFLQRSP